MFPTVTYVDSLPVIAIPTAVKFNLDGTKMYVTGPGTNPSDRIQSQQHLISLTGVFSQNSIMEVFSYT